MRHLSCSYELRPNLEFYNSDAEALEALSGFSALSLEKFISSFGVKSWSLYYRYSLLYFSSSRVYWSSSSSFSSTMTSSTSLRYFFLRMLSSSKSWFINDDENCTRLLPLLITVLLSLLILALLSFINESSRFVCVFFLWYLL